MSQPTRHLLLLKDQFKSLYLLQANLAPYSLGLLSFSLPQGHSSVIPQFLLLYLIIHTNMYRFVYISKYVLYYIVPSYESYYLSQVSYFSVLLF